MAIYAILDTGNAVANAIVAEDDATAQAICASIYPGKTCVLIPEDTSAGIGHRYDPAAKAFVAPGAPAPAKPKTAAKTAS